MTRWLVVLLAACGGRAQPPAAPPPSPPVSPLGAAAGSGAAFEIVPQAGRSGVQFLAFLPGGAHAVTSSRLVTQVWQVENGIMLSELAETDAVAVTGGGVVDRRLAVHDLVTNTRGASRADAADLAAATPDGTRLVAASTTGALRVIDLVARATLRTIALPRARALAIAADGKTALAVDDRSGAASQVHILDLDAGRIAGALAHDGAWCAALSADGKRALIGGSDGAVWLYDVASRLPIMTFTGHFSFVHAVAFMPDGTQAVSAGSDGTLRVWDLIALRLLRSIKAERVEALAVSPDGRHVLSGASFGEGLRIWDTQTGQPARSLRTIASVSSVSLSADGRRALVGGHDGLVSLWDLDTGARLRAFPQVDLVPAVALSPDGARALVAGKDAARVLETATGKVLATSSKLDARAVAWLPDGRAVIGSEEGRVLVWAPATGQRQILREYGDAVYGVAAAPDGARVASAAWDGGVTVWDLARGTELVTFRGHARRPSCVAFTPDGKTVVSGGDGGAFAWDAATGAERWHVANNGDVRGVAVSPDGKRVATIGYQIILLDAATGAELKTLNGEPRPTSFQFHPDGVHGISTGMLGTSHVWNLDTGAAYAQISSGADWLIYTPDGYFDASRQGSELVAAVRALRNNRPDLVLRSVGMGRPELLDHFRARHDHRLARAGLDEPALATRFDRAPRVTGLEVTVDGATAKLAFELASTAELRSYNVYVNDVPLFGAQGKPATGTRAAIRETIALSEGRNKLEVAGLDRGGAESMRAVRVVIAARPAARRELYFLGIGVSRYRNPAFDLAYPAKDVADLAAVLRAMPGFAAVHVETYTDARATGANVRAARQFLAKAGVDDTVVLFVAGHGMRGYDARAAFYFLTHEADPDHLATTAVDFEVIEELLHGLSARKKLLLLDACESGELDRERDAALAPSRTTHLVPRWMGVRKDRPAARAVAPPAHRFAFDRERFIYNDLLRRSGAVVLSSSTGAELSYEDATLRNGVFTEALMIALTSDRADRDRDGRVTITELQLLVTSEAARMTGDLQHPALDRDNLEIDLWLPVAASAAAVVGR